MRGIRRRLLAACALLLVSACATARPPADPPLPSRAGPTRLPDGVTPTAYQLSLEVDPEQTTFSGVVRIHLHLEQPTDRLHLHAEDTHIDSAVVRADDRAVPAAVAPADDPWADPDGGEQVVRLATPVGPGPVVLEIRYRSPFDGHLAGLYRVEHEGAWYAFTQFEAADARKAFPCLDEPRWKTPFSLSVRVPSGMLAVSNMPESDRIEDTDSTTFVFRETPPLPTYLVALAVGRFDVASAPESRRELRGLAARGRGTLLGYALGVHAELLEVLEAYLGSPLPYPKLDLVAVPEFSAGAMENVGLITYREELLLVDPVTSGPDARKRVEGAAAHELAHQWFGNLVTPAWWDDLWLNEAFATWMSARAVDTWRPESEARLGLLEKRGWAFGTDSLAAARAVRQPVTTVADAENAFDGLTYVKGAEVLSMLESWLGEEVFRDGLRAYLESHAHRTATSADLFAALESASERPVAEVARSFVDRAGVPLVRAQLDCAGDHAAQVTLVQSRYRSLGSPAPEGFPDAEPWVVPVCIAWGGGGEAGERCLLLAEPGTTVTLPAEAGCPRWVHPNRGEHGYYRWRVDAEQLEALAAAVADAGGESGRRARTALLEQTWASVESGELEVAAFLRLVERLARSDDARVRRAVVGAVERLAGTWETLADSEAFAAWVRRLLGPEGLRLGFSHLEGELHEDTLLRPRVLWVLGRHGRDPAVLAEADRRARAWLDSPTALPPEVATTALSLAAHSGALDRETLVRALESEPPPAARVALVRALGHLPAGEPLGGALQLMLGDTIRVQDVWYLFGGAFGSAARRRQTLAFVRERFDALAARLPSFGPRSAGRLAGWVGVFCDADEREAARAYFEEKRLPGSERFLAQGLERADRCVAVRAAGRASLAQALGGPGD